MNTSQLFQVPIKDDDLNMFRSPVAQPEFNPRNCGGVSGQLLGLVTPKKANQMTQSEQGIFIADWANHISSIIRTPLYSVEKSIDLFENFFMNNLFPGFATLVVTYPAEGSGHFFVIAKSIDNQLVFLDAQIRRGFRNKIEYFNKFARPPAKFQVIFHEGSIPISQHKQYSDTILRIVITDCSNDVEMSGGKRKKQRKTKRLRRSKKTLRRRTKA